MTKSDDVLRSYLGWKASKPVPRLPCRCPEDWLGALYTLNYSSEQDLISIRSALSFGRVNYLTLASDSHRGDLYIVISDPTALGPFEQDQNMFGSSSSSLMDVHPALIRLSFKNIKPDRPTPTFVMPVGCVFKILNPYGRPDLKTMEKVAELLKKDIAPVEDSSLSAWRSIYGISSNTNAMPDHAPETQAYIKEIAIKLAEGSQIADLRKDQEVERRRCEAWRAVLRNPRSFQDTNYVVVVDAVDPNHPVWLIRRPNQQNEEGERDCVSENTYTPLPFEHLHRSVFDAAQIFPRVSEWIKDYYDETVYSFSPSIENTYIKGLITVHFADAQQYERERMLSAAK